MSTHNVSKQTDLLEEARLRFSTFRREHPRARGIPLHLRRLAVELMETGLSGRRIAEGLCISAASLCQWRKKCIASTEVRVLTLVADIAPTSTPIQASQQENEHYARIVTGAFAIELSVAAISTPLLRTISEAMS